MMSRKGGSTLKLPTPSPAAPPPRAPCPPHAWLADADVRLGPLLGAGLRAGLGLPDLALESFQKAPEAAPVSKGGVPATRAGEALGPVCAGGRLGTVGLLVARRLLLALD